MVVLTVLGGVLLMTLPRFGNLLPAKGGEDGMARLVTTIETVKKKSYFDHVDYTLHIDMESDTIWITHKGMSLEMITSAKTEATTLGQGYDIEAVTFFGLSKGKNERVDQETAYEAIPIHFNGSGYSDMALIQCRRSDQDQHDTLFLSPFLAKIEIFHGDGPFFFPCD